MLTTPPPRPLPSIVWPFRSSVMLPVPMTRALSGQSSRSFMTLTLSSSTSPQTTSRATAAGRMRQVYVSSVSPAGLIARKVNVWVPTARLGYSFGEAQAAQSPLSSLHWKVAPPSASNSKIADVCTVVGSGADVIVTSGAVVSGTSTHHVYDAGVRSTFPAASTARTANVWLPTGSSYDAGDEHGPHAMSKSGSGESSEHWNETL